jgi:hypothetical protein
MLIETIATGLGIIASVSTLIRNMRTTSCNDRPSYNPSAQQVNQNSISRVSNVELRVAELDRQIQEYRNNSQDLPKIMNNYSELIKILQESTLYKGQLQFIPTSYGTWKLVKINKKPKNVILRDPKGEYSYSDE